MYLKDPIYNDGHLVRIIQALKFNKTQEMEIFDFNHNSTLKRNMSNFNNL